MPAQIPKPPPVLLLLSGTHSAYLGAVAGTPIFYQDAPWKNSSSALARSKTARPRTDRGLVKKQLLLFVDESNIGHALLEEAVERVRDSRTSRAAEKVVEILLAITIPIDPAIDALVERRAVLLGASRLDRKLAPRMRATTVAGVHGAAMIEGPQPPRKFIPIKG